jgi:hypothetical protein
MLKSIREVMHTYREAGDSSDGYRDVKLSVVYEERETIRVIGEIQVSRGWVLGRGDG